MAFGRLLWGVFFLLSLSLSAAAADRAIVILDASGSMWGQIDGKPKLMIARETLHSVLPTLPPDLELGFMAYGHREKGSCDDIELIVPPAANTAGAINIAADNLKFLGKTPLTAAVKQAAEALKYTEDKATVILITDGLETCNADPCALGKELKQSGVDFTAHVVGFGLTAEEGREVACLAENTGGKYFQANDAAGLRDALAQTVAAPAPAPEPAAAPAPEPARPEFNFMPVTTLAEGGPAVDDIGLSYEVRKADAAGGEGERVTTEYGAYKGNLEPGDYVVRAGLGEASLELPVKIEGDKVAAPSFVLNAGTLIIHPRPSEGAETANGATVVIGYPRGERPVTTYGDTKIVLPAGEAKVTVKIGGGEVSETIQLAAGQTIEKDIIVGVGHVVANAYYTAGGDKVDAGGLAFQVVKAKKKIDGSREDLGTEYGADSKYDLPPGDYVVIARMDEAVAEAPFSLAAGEAKNVDVSLDAGVLAVNAPGAYQIEIFAAKKDIGGNRKPFGSAYADTLQTTLPPGDYAILVTLPDNGGTKEGSATVKAGERSEVKIQ
ncbi:VWA domain-containing protein [Mesorhizobium sp. BAC0120]|uniref:vWA domain-containing protein n=1 Tax=Mesorhizobium sp. BAC0120 TaxID=3090670 RepID=UPI00298C5DB6|nr:VWA domain-containing protein [Mesorhizobium sp. BAC0120]MDW6025101.1 VWA domain-containing protein [Mesorhizobium sp. BAC0120]